MRRILLAAATLLAFAACGPGVRRGIRTAAPSAGDLAAIRAADVLSSRGSFVALKEAGLIYERLYARPETREAAAAGYFRAVFLRALREKELGVTGGAALSLARRLVAENPSLDGFKTWPDAATEIPLRVKGVVADTIPWLERVLSEEESRALRGGLFARAAADATAAYFYLALACPAKSPYESVDDRASVLAAHPRSVPILFRTGFCPELVAERFDEVLAADPEFWEAYGFRAEAALGRGELLAAEKDLLTAFARIPESAHFPALLARVYFFTEEYEESIAFCDRALALSPEYRDVILTKAIGLSQLGRFEEAVEALNRLLELRYYLQGEARYWLAWNLHALDDLEAARDHIEQAKGPMPTNSSVFALAGTLALEGNEPDRAEADFREALVYNPANEEALLGLAGIAERRSRYLEAAGLYERTAAVLDANQAAWNEKVAEIEASGLPEPRRVKMRAKKEAQIRASETVEAAALFNAAAAWANAGRFAEARAAAGRAAGHPQFKERVAELLETIKDRKESRPGKAGRSS